MEIEDELENEKNKDKISELNSRSAKTILEIGSLRNKKSKEEKRLERLIAENKNILLEMRGKISRLGAELK